MHEKWNRAIQFLKDRGHTIGPWDGDHVSVDERSYLIGEVHELIKSENAYLAGLIGKP